MEPAAGAVDFDYLGSVTKEGAARGQRQTSNFERQTPSQVVASEQPPFSLQR